MALRIPHTSGGQVHWLQGIDYTTFFTSKTAITLDFTYKINSYDGSDQCNILQAIVSAMFGFTQFSTSIQDYFSGVSGGVGSALNDGLWHRVQMTVATNGGNMLTLIDGGVVDTRAFAAPTTSSNPQSLMWIGPQNQSDGWSATVDFSIDQFNAWNDRVLTLPQLSSLAQGLTHATDYGTAANRFRFDFTQQTTGTVNGPPVEGGGDSGLYDLDHTVPGFWVTHGAPVWNSSTYIYTNPMTLDAPTIRTSGSSIEFTAKDASGNPILITYVEGQPVTSPSLAINGGSPFYMTHDGTSTGRRLNLVDGVDNFPSNWSIRKQKILNTDVVSVTIPAGLFRGANGALNVFTTKTAVNHAGVVRTNFDGSVVPNHPRVGVVGSGQDPFVAEFYWSNHLLNTSTWYEYGGNGQARFTFDSVGNVTGITGQTGTGLPRIAVGLGTFGMEGGTYTLLYTAGTPFLTGDGGGSEGGAGITLLDSGTLGGVHRKRYSVAQGTALNVQGDATTHSIQLLGPNDVDGTGYASKGMIRSSIIDMYGNGNMNIFRALNAVNNSAADFSYLSPDGWFSPWNGKEITTAVTSMTQIANTFPPTPLWFKNTNLYCYYCVCPAPHGLVSGQILGWTGTGGPDGAGGVDGTNNAMIYVDSPTTFYSNWGNPDVVSIPNPSFSATYRAYVVPSYGVDVDLPQNRLNGMYALDRLVNQCNACGTDLWFTYPVCWDDTSVAQAATYFATHLNPGLKLYCEWGNEIWNSGSTVFQYGNKAGLQAGYPLANSGANWCGVRSAQVGYVGRAAWDATKTSLGQATGGYVRLLSWQSVAAGVCASECVAPAKAWWAAQGYPGKFIDAISLAPYSGGETVGYGTVTGNQRLADWYLATPYGTDLDPEEVIDIVELSVEGYYVRLACQQYHDLICVPEGIPMVWYEWGFDPAPNDQTVESGMPAHNYPGGNVRMVTILGASQQHKRMGNVTIRSLNVGAEFGCIAACYLGSTGFQIQKYGNEGLRWTQYQTSGSDYTTWGDGSGNTDLFVTSANLLGGPPDAPNAYALAKVAQTSSGPPPDSHSRFDESLLAYSILATGLGSMCGGQN